LVIQRIAGDQSIRRGAWLFQAASAVHQLNLGVEPVDALLHPENHGVRVVLQLGQVHQLVALLS